MSDPYDYNEPEYSPLELELLDKIYDLEIIIQTLERENNEIYEKLETLTQQSK